MDYRRCFVPGARYFFTQATHARQPLFNDVELVNLLRRSFRCVTAKRPFRLDAICVLPDHLHCIWELPEGDSDFPTRWRLVKTHFCRQAKQSEPIWQNRYWEHLIRDDEDYRKHLDYIHYNPVKHGLSTTPREWEWSSFGRHVKLGVYEEGWGEVCLNEKTQKRRP